MQPAGVHVYVALPGHVIESFSLFIFSRDINVHVACVSLYAPTASKAESKFLLRVVEQLNRTEKWHATYYSVIPSSAF